MIGNSWDLILRDEFNSEYFSNIMNRINSLYEEEEVYPPKKDIFKALELTSFEDVRVVILGQDPYIRKGQAMGLSFSVPKTCKKIPSSLKNIFKEMHDDIGIELGKSGDLTPWAKNGVLLLNCILTVEEGKSLSHKYLGWEKFTDTIISSLNEKERVVYILWGNFAKTKGSLITNKNHLVITGGHPSFANVHKKFFGGEYFSLANEYLNNSISWKLN